MCSCPVSDSLLHQHPAQFLPALNLRWQIPNTVASIWFFGFGTKLLLVFHSGPDRARGKTFATPQCIVGNGILFRVFPADWPWRWSGFVFLCSLLQASSSWAHQNSYLREKKSYLIERKICSNMQLRSQDLSQLEVLGTRLNKIGKI